MKLLCFDQISTNFTLKLSCFASLDQKVSKRTCPNKLTGQICVNLAGLGKPFNVWPQRQARYARRHKNKIIREVRNRNSVRISLGKNIYLSSVTTIQGVQKEPLWLCPKTVRVCPNLSETLSTQIYFVRTGCPKDVEWYIQICPTIYVYIYLFVRRIDINKTNVRTVRV